MTLDLATRATGGYPADLRAAAGLKISKVGLRADISLDLSQTQKLTSAPAGGLVPVQDPATGLIQALDFAELPTSNPADGSVANVKLTAVPSLTVKGNATQANAQPQDVPLSTIAATGNPVGDAIDLASTIVPQYGKAPTAPALKLQDADNDRVYLRKFDNRVGNNNPTVDTAALKLMAQVVQFDSEYRGRKMRLGAYGRPLRLGETITFKSFAQLQNVCIEGEGMTTSRIDFGDCPAGQGGLVFTNGSQIILRDFDVVGSKTHNIRIGSGTPFSPLANDGVTVDPNAFVQNIHVENIRSQGAVGDGIYLMNVFEARLVGNHWLLNGGAGFSARGGHTTLALLGGWASNNTGPGWVINGTVYSEAIALGSDHNLIGYQISNCNSVGLTSCGAEQCQREGIAITTGNALAGGLPAEYQDIATVAIDRFFTYQNNLAGGFADALSVLTADGRPAEVAWSHMRSVARSATTAAIVLNGASGPVTTVEGPRPSYLPKGVVTAGAVGRDNRAVTGKRCSLRRAAAQAIASGTETIIAWDAAPARNDLNAGVAGNGIVIPAGVSKVRVSASVAWDSNSTGARILAITKNAATLSELPVDFRAASLNSTHTVCSLAVDVAQNDIIRVNVNQFSGGSLNVSGGANCWFTVEAVN